MNKYILLVMKWMDDKNSVSQKELIENKKDAYAAYAAYDAAHAAYAAYAAYDAAYAAYDAAYAAYDADSSRWIKKYFELSRDNRQDYIDEINKGKRTKGLDETGKAPDIAYHDGKGYEIGGVYEFSHVDGTWELGVLTGIKNEGDIYQSINGSKLEWFALIRLPTPRIGSITDNPIQLDHGKAYQFINIEGNTIVGIYDEDEHSFKTNCVEWSEYTCENITPLVPIGL